MMLYEKTRARPAHNHDLPARSAPDTQTISAMVLGVGSFAYSTAQILKDSGAAVSTYLTRDYAHHSPSLAGPTFLREQFPSPCPLVRQQKTDLLIPMSIDWAQAPW